MVTDDILYRHYLGGDEDSLSALMERHGDKLTLYLDGCLHDLHESEDLMIEVFAYLIAKQPRIRDGGFRAYLYRSGGGLSCGDPRSRAGDAVRHGALLRRGLLWRHDRQSVHR